METTTQLGEVQQASTTCTPVPLNESNYSLALEWAQSESASDSLCELSENLSQLPEFGKFVGNYLTRFGLKVNYASPDCASDGDDELDILEMRSFIATLVMAGILHGSLFSAGATFKSFAL